MRRCGRCRRIARVLDDLQPTPALYPAQAPLAVPLAQWADSTLFQAAVVWAMQPGGIQAILGNPSPETLKTFATDRAAMRGIAPRITLADGVLAGQDGDITGAVMDAAQMLALLRD